MKVSISIRSLSLSCFILISGCASLQQAYIAQSCNPNAAYAIGINDAKNGLDMKLNFAALCPNNQVTLNAAYREGYQFGLSAVNEGTHVNVYAKKRYQQAGINP